MEQPYKRPLHILGVYSEPTVYHIQGKRKSDWIFPTALHTFTYIQFTIYSMTCQQIYKILSDIFHEPALVPVEIYSFSGKEVNTFTRPLTLYESHWLECPISPVDYIIS